MHTVLFNEEAVKKRVGEIASQVSRDYAGRKLVLISILKAAFIFTADLMRRVTVPSAVEFVQASSYGDCAVSTGVVAVNRNSKIAVEDKHILLVDTIVDTGATFHCLIEKFKDQKPASIATVALLDKKVRRTLDVAITYRGFEIPDVFVVGYGMDFSGRYRNLPYIAELTLPAQNIPS